MKPLPRKKKTESWHQTTTKFANKVCPIFIEPHTIFENKYDEILMDKMMDRQGDFNLPPTR